MKPSSVARGSGYDDLLRWQRSLLHQRTEQVLDLASGPFTAGDRDQHRALQLDDPRQLPRHPKVADIGPFRPARHPRQLAAVRYRVEHTEDRYTVDVAAALEIDRSSRSRGERHPAEHERQTEHGSVQSQRRRADADRRGIGGRNAHDTGRRRRGPPLDQERLTLDGQVRTLRLERQEPLLQRTIGRRTVPCLLGAVVRDLRGERCELGIDRGDGQVVLTPGVEGDACDVVVGQPLRDGGAGGRACGRGRHADDIGLAQLRNGGRGADRVRGQVQLARHLG